MPPRAIDPKEFDHTVKPTDDFFGYVNNTWIEKNPIPANESRWGSFSILRVEVEGQLKKIMEGLDAASENDLDENGRKVRNFYRTGMDVEALNKIKDQALAEIMGVINGIKNTDDAASAIGFLHRRGIGAWWASSSEPDAKQSDVMALYLSQGGLSLPDRDYYLNTDEQSIVIRKRYAEYTAHMVTDSSLANLNGEAMKLITDLEAALASVSMTRVELRDIEKQYNKMTPEELVHIAPHINWSRYFEAIGIPMPAYMIVCQPKFMEAASRLFETLPIESIKAYLRWHVLNVMANFLGEGFEKRSFDFYGKTFGGATEMKPRWRRVLAVVNGMLDEAVGKLYVERHFSESAKERVGKLVDHLSEAYRTRIKKLDWMGEETKQKALTKLDAIRRKLAYPDKWKDISALVILNDSYAENYMRAYTFEFDRVMKKIGQPVDRTEWYMSPQTVNACYNPLMNEILFPAAILQPPFFYPDGDDAVNFGAIGTVIGHELTHGFDDQGALFDPHGNLVNWWTADDKLRFDAQTDHLAQQFDEYEPLPGLHVNGRLTLGENIADLGGLLIAYDGLMLALRENPVEKIDGLTPQQRFFINCAIYERENRREEALRLAIQTDPHAPSMCRINGPLSNMQEFYEVFGCKPGDALWRDTEDQVKIW
jgi:putative endopeptidase